mgnify:CR=1 FL=1
MRDHRDLRLVGTLKGKGIGFIGKDQLQIGFDLLGLDRLDLGFGDFGARVTKGIADVGDDVGDVLVGQAGDRGHHAVIRDALDGDRTLHAVDDVADSDRGVLGDPLRTGEGREDGRQAHARRLVAGDAGAGVDGLAALQGGGVGGGHSGGGEEDEGEVLEGGHDVACN